MNESLLHLVSSTTALSPDLLEAFEREAKARRRKPDALLREVLEDLADARAAEAARKRSAGKPTISLGQLRKELNL